MPATQRDREVSVKTALADDVLLFASMDGTEELGRLFEYTVTMMSEDANIAVADVLGKPLDVIVTGIDGTTKRYFNGIVTHFAYTGWKQNLAIYTATVRPAMWLLTRASNCRIFQDKNVPDIVKAVCTAYGGDVSLDPNSLNGTYPVLPYCVQYRETDFSFVCRLLEQAGIYFYFVHTAGRHTMVLADSPGAHNLIPGYNALRFAGRSFPVLSPEEALTWSSSGAITAGSYALNDFDYEKAQASVSGALRAKAAIPAAFGQADYEMYDYPGNYMAAADGTALARAHMERQHGQGEKIMANTTARGLYAGGLFTLKEHPRTDANRTYLVTAARFDITGNDYTTGAERDLAFSCDIEAIGKEHAFRPVPVTFKPVMHGPQTAMVVGKAGEEIWTDQYGRIKVQFHWDRVGKSDENSSCWVRVAQGWAGKNWGAMAIPRVGMEVVVSFLEGDPDRPLVTGCVYNSDAQPPYPLPAHQTRSGIKSQSTKGGDGFNELRFEDKKGAEEVFMHAERDFLRVVKNNDALKVGFETADKGDQTVDIKNDQTTAIGNNQTITITADQKLDIDGNQKVKVGQTIVIEAGTSIELKVGGSSIKIEAGKITIKAPEIEVAADANAKVKAGAMMEIKSGAVMTIGGALVQIN